MTWRLVRVLSSAVTSSAIRPCDGLSLARSAGALLGNEAGPGAKSVAVGDNSDLPLLLGPGLVTNGSDKPPTAAIWPLELLTPPRAT
jgi:hypothetical protein